MEKMKNRDLKNSSWVFLHVEGFKIHICPRQLFDEVYDDLITRGGGEVYSVQGTEEMGWDPGGMIMQDRTYQEVKIDSGRLWVASQDFSAFVARLERMPLRTFSNGKKYYKIHGWLHCLVFTPEQRDLVLAWAKKLLPDVEKIAEQEDKEFEKRIVKINDAPGGPHVLTNKDPRMKMKQDDAGRVTVEIRQALSGLPNDAKN